MLGGLRSDALAGKQPGSVFAASVLPRSEVLNPMQGSARGNLKVGTHLLNGRPEGHVHFVRDKHGAESEVRRRLRGEAAVARLVDVGAHDRKRGNVRVHVAHFLVTVRARETRTGALQRMSRTRPGIA